MTVTVTWPAITDEIFVEKLIPVLQQAIAAAEPKARTPGGQIPIDGADLANVLLMLLATVLEPSPSAAT
ncbi:MAG TPA: hypothetical protein VF695_10355, partial [Sphingomonas sp.]